METEKREGEYVGEGSTAISDRDSCDALLHAHTGTYTHTLRVLWHSEDQGGWVVVVVVVEGNNVAQE